MTLSLRTLLRNEIGGVSANSRPDPAGKLLDQFAGRPSNVRNYLRCVSTPENFWRRFR